MNKVLLCILDGFGYRTETFGNATTSAEFINSLIHSGNTAFLDASGESVGLPHGQCGNSEVGHFTIGTGRILKQKLPLIDDAIRDGSLEKNENLNKFIGGIHGNACHLMTLFSNGGVHSSLNHFYWAVSYLRRKNIDIRTHLFLDGRDVGFRDALDTLVQALSSGNLQLSEIATIQGRFFAMDRDNRWERTQEASDAIIDAKASYHTEDPISLIQNFYEERISDEVIPPITISNYSGASKGDSFWMLNFRTDRIKQILTKILSEPSEYRLLDMVNCGETIDQNATILFGDEEIRNPLGEVLAMNGIHQLRIAETEKYAHVTYFFDGGKDTTYPNEERILIPSPRVDDYSRTPDMSSSKITEEIINAMKVGTHEVIISNYANADMIGHTGNMEATQASLKHLDAHITEIIRRSEEYGYTVILTADHGNAENMMKPDLSIHKNHTCSNVPFVIYPSSMEIKRSHGQLSDIAPTILKILNIDPPREMTGTSLI
ncbi:MAG: 2,3-bisphosphoglycerate-independent phosphoglycerate mutase [Holosporales bacterium]|jgi:2,3-bisphosphoglycerate-independent phosphoglycerate mutase|nr:2,3-bisphosphoglycerate-independent phosphoglycerate mutase [Holosporales bacterium]